MNKRKNKKKNNKNNGKGYGIATTNKYSVYNGPRFTFLDPHMYLTLRYTETFNNTLLTLVASSQVFNLNSPFDPNRTGGGHQPYGYDQITLMYNRYRVLSCKWSIVVGSTTGTFHATVVPTNGLLPVAITNAATFEAASEVPHAKTRVLSINAPAVTFRGSMPLNVLNGCLREEYLADDRFEAITTASPAEIMVLYIGLYNPTAATIVNSNIATVEYEIDFHDPILLGQS